MADAVLEGKAAAPKLSPAAQKAEAVAAASTEAAAAEGERGRRGGRRGGGDRQRREPRSETQRLPGGKLIAALVGTREIRNAFSIGVLEKSLNTSGSSVCFPEAPAKSVAFPLIFSVASI